MTIEQTTPPTQVELVNRLAGQHMALGRAKKTLGEAIAMGLDPTEASNAVDAVQKRITELEAGLERLKERAANEKADQLRLSKQVEAQIEYETLTHLVKVGRKVQAWLDEADGLFKDELIHAMNAARELPNESIRFQVSTAMLRFFPCLMEVVKGMPGVKIAPTLQKTPWINFLPTPKQVDKP